ncbi:MAG: hypothetical protein ACC742_12760, partial [Thermoanaerobaculales bacterium]
MMVIDKSIVAEEESWILSSQFSILSFQISTRGSEQVVRADCPRLGALTGRAASNNVSPHISPDFVARGAR